MGLGLQLFKYLEEEAVAGVYIGEDYITAACLFFDKDGSISLKNAGWIENEPASTDATLISRIKKLWSTSRIHTNIVSCAFHTPFLAIRHFRYNNFSDEDVRSALQLEAEQAFQRPSEELSIDWHLYSQQNGEKEGILVAMPDDVINHYVRVLQKAGLYPIVLDVACMSLANLFFALRGRDRDKTVCLVHVGTSAADFSIIGKDGFMYSRNLYAQTFSWEQKRYELADNIKDILRYYQFKLHREPIDTVVCTGYLSSKPEFQEEVKKHIEQVEFWNPFDDILLYKKDALQEDLRQYGYLLALSAGLAMRRENGF